MDGCADPWERALDKAESSDTSSLSPRHSEAPPALTPLSPEPLAEPPPHAAKSPGRPELQRVLGLVAEGLEEAEAAALLALSPKALCGALKASLHHWKALASGDDGWGSREEGPGRGLVLERCVLLDGLPADLHSCRAAFLICGMYGAVLRVGLCAGGGRAAVVEMASAQDAGCVVAYLAGLRFEEGHFQVKARIIQASRCPSGVRLRSVWDFSAEAELRTARELRRHPPSATLFVHGLYHSRDDVVTRRAYHALFRDQGFCVDQVKLRGFCGWVRLGSAGEAARALVRLTGHLDARHRHPKRLYINFAPTLT